MTNLPIKNMSINEVVNILTTKGAPYFSVCHLSDELVLVDYHNNELRAFASLKVPNFVTQLLSQWVEILWAGNVPNSTYTYFDIWRPEHGNIDDKNIPLLRELGFIEVN
jgi:hypothetical protein